jgi:hypothetical protein
MCEHININSTVVANKFKAHDPRGWEPGRLANDELTIIVCTSCKDCGACWTSTSYEGVRTHNSRNNEGRCLVCDSFGTRGTEHTYGEGCLCERPR